MAEPPEPPKVCPDCGWTPPKAKDSSPEDLIAAHAMNVSHPKRKTKPRKKAA